MNHRIESFAKYAGFATVGVEWLALLFYYIQMPAYFGGSYPISYFSSLPQTRLVFNICYTLAGLFFWIFIRHHLHKLYPAPIKIIALSMLLFIGLAVVPFNPTSATSSHIHNILGLTSAFFFVAGLYVMAKNAKDKKVYWVSVSSIIISLILFVAFFSSPKESHYNFVLEAGSWLVWQIWVLWISFYSLKKVK